MPETEKPDRGVLEQIVAEEYLVGALPAQHHLDPLPAGQPGEQKEGGGRGPQERRLGMSDDVGKRECDVARGDAFDRMPALYVTGSGLLKGAFIEARIFER